MSELLADKTVLVTGAANGIGAASAERFAAHGARVVLVDVDADHGEANAEAIRTAGGDATFVRGDVSSAADVKAFLAAAVDRYGRIDAALNNAGIEETGTPFHESSEDGWDALHAVNLKGVFLCMKYEIRQMLAQGGGTIVNMASVAGLIGLPLGIGTYAATKHGVVGLTRTAAIEYARQGIRVNAVCPGVVRTAMLDSAINAGMFTPEEAAALHPTGALLSPRDVAETAAWLCSDVSGGMTGQAVAVDAGMTAG
ncbi:SDR family oxidoreductase [Actinocatenispora rupis]|uniref:Short chain dehydrogenase n=1 Tax=Actinocatenispora rupis TaxID=519421 RepID=A0A8J3JFH5_9ACTN|nr:SDR family oxidoreductase [Actinocatenispora rupis]GID15477.1 short chain dehydrogenase [Actinocatenispora rupis]